jgi:hypothetical protein
MVDISVVEGKYNVCIAGRTRSVFFPELRRRDAVPFLEMPAEMAPV